MHRVIEQATASGTPVLRWCLLDVLERCRAKRECATCPLWEDCHGVAKEKCDGFVRIDDAIAMKRRVSRDTWDAEMMCRKPSARGAVFPSFDVALHVVDTLPPSTQPLSTQPPPAPDLAIDFGFAAPFVCLWVRTLADGTTHVIDEYVQPMRTLHEHLEQIAARPWGKATRIACDPSGSGRNDQTAASNVALLRQAGYTVRYRKSLIAHGLELLRAALRPALGEPKLFIHPRCEHLIAAMKGYHYAPGGSELPVKDGVHDHLIDALRYH